MDTPTPVFEGIHFRVFHENVNIIGSGPKLFEYVWRRDGTRVLAVRADHSILLTREFRHELKDYDWRLPGGKLNDELEPPEVAAAREFEEETGLVPLHLESLGATIPFATIRYKIHFFLTYDPKEGHRELESGEKIDIYWLPLSQVMQMALSGEIQEGISALTIIRFAFDVACGKRRIPPNISR